MIASTAILVASPALARRGDYVLTSQIEDEETAIRASLNGAASVKISKRP